MRPFLYGTAALIAGLTLLASAPVRAQPSDHFVLGPDQFKFDQTHGGAVLCAWSIYLQTQAATKVCGLTRTPTDDAIDRAITEVDAFIMANSSLHPTRAALDDFKRRTSESFVHSLQSRDLQAYCRGEDLQAFRGGSPAQVEQSVRALLATPREPVLNPCL
jgi:hypothetical protein